MDAQKYITFEQPETGSTREFFDFVRVASKDQLEKAASRCREVMARATSHASQAYETARTRLESLEQALRSF